MKKVKLGLTAVSLIAIAAFGQTNIPDDNFEQALIDLGVDDVLDDYVATESIDTLESLDLWNMDIDDLTGIGDFSALKYLDCSYNNLVDLDLSGNSELLYLICGENDLNNLNLTENLALQKLWGGHNQLSELDLSNCIHLEVLDLRNNSFETIDLTLNEELIQIIVSENELIDINCSGLSNLEGLYCSNNNLTEVDVADLPVLKNLYVDHNPIEEINLTLNPNLTILQCQNALLESLDLSANPLLDVLICSDNFLDSLDVTNNPDLSWLDCKNNKLTKLDLSGNSDVYILICNDNELTYLNVKNGNNVEIDDFHFRIFNNPDLFCVEVDDPVFSEAAWTSYIDEAQSFSSDCDYAGLASDTNVGLNIYPQPAVDYVMIEVGEALAYQIFDLSGKMILEGSIVSGEHSIPTESFETGVYLFKWRTENKNGVRRLHFQSY